MPNTQMGELKAQKRHFYVPRCSVLEGREVLGEGP